MSFKLPEVAPNEASLKSIISTPSFISLMVIKVAFSEAITERKLE